VLRIELANQVSFLNRALLSKRRLYQRATRRPRAHRRPRHRLHRPGHPRPALRSPRHHRSPPAASKVSFLGHEGPQHQRRLTCSSSTTRAARCRAASAPQSVLEILQAGNQRFLAGERIQRDFGRQITATSTGQFPMAAILGCIDSRAPAETVFRPRPRRHLQRPCGWKHRHRRAARQFGIRLRRGGIKARRRARSHELRRGECRCRSARRREKSQRGNAVCATSTVSSRKSSRPSIPPRSKSPMRGLLVKKLPTPTKSPASTSSAPSRPSASAAPALEQARAEEGKIAIVGALYDVTTGEVSFFQTAESSVAKLSVPMVAVA
jgi:hypothetical protein